MALDLAVIFGDKTRDEPIVVPVATSISAEGTPSANPVCTPDAHVTPKIIKPLPIPFGTEHFSIWVDDPDGPLPEFIPGYHYDFRQPSRLRGLCSPRPKAPPRSNASGNKGMQHPGFTS